MTLIRKSKRWQKFVGGGVRVGATGQYLLAPPQGSGAAGYAFIMKIRTGTIGTVQCLLDHARRQVVIDADGFVRCYSNRATDLVIWSSNAQLAPATNYDIEARVIGDNTAALRINGIPYTVTFNDAGGSTQTGYTFLGASYLGNYLFTGTIFAYGTTNTTVTRNLFFSSDAKALRFWNNGKGMYSERPFRFLKENQLEFVDIWVFSSHNVGQAGFRGKYGGGAIAPVHMSYTAYNEQLKGLCLTRVADVIIPTPYTYQFGTEIRQYLYEEAFPNLPSLNLTGAWVRIDDPANQNLPASWTGKDVNAAGNKWGGVAANETTLSVIRNIDVTSFNAPNQTPAGFDETYLEFQGNVGTVNLNNCKKKKVVITTKNNALVTCTSLDVGKNVLVQTLAELVNLTYFRPAALLLSDAGPGLTGQVPTPDDRLIDLRINNTGILLPSNLNKMDYVSADGCLVSGVIKGEALRAVFLSGTVANSNFTIDLAFTTTRNDIRFLYASNNVGKLVGLILRDGLLIQDITMDVNDFPAINFSVHPNTRYTQTFIMRQIPTFANTVFPLGTIILATNIDIRDNNMTEAAVNGTFDSFIANQANFANSGTFKRLTCYGTNAAISNTGYTGNRSSRLSHVLESVKTNNWFMLLRVEGSALRSYYQVRSFTNPEADTIIFFLNNNVGSTTTGATFEVSHITNDTVLNGTYTVVSKGTDAAASNGQNSSSNNPMYVKATKAGVGTGHTVSDQGVFRL